jgi:hypothetical protein
MNKNQNDLNFYYQITSLTFTIIIIIQLLMTKLSRIQVVIKFNLNALLQMSNIFFRKINIAN